MAASTANPSRSSRIPRHRSASGSWRHRRYNPLRSSRLPRHRSASGNRREVACLSLPLCLQLGRHCSFDSTANGEQPTSSPPPHTVLGTAHLTPDAPDDTHPAPDAFGTLTSLALLTPPSMPDLDVCAPLTPKSPLPDPLDVTVVAVGTAMARPLGEGGGGLGLTCSSPRQGCQGSCGHVSQGESTAASTFMRCPQLLDPIICPPNFLYYVGRFFGAILEARADGLGFMDYLDMQGVELCMGSTCPWARRLGPYMRSGTT
jgi:hypothetical protein